MVTEVFKINEILEALEGIDVVAVIAEGFKALSQGKVDIPPIGEMLFPEVVPKICLQRIGNLRILVEGLCIKIILYHIFNM